MQFMLDKINTAVNSDLIDRINRTIEAATDEFEYMKQVEPPVVLRDTTGSLPEDVAGPFWIREAGEKWELTAMKFRELHSMRTVSSQANCRCLRSMGLFYRFRVITGQPRGAA